MDNKRKKCSFMISNKKEENNFVYTPLYQKMEIIALNRERLKKANSVLFFIFHGGGHVGLHFCHGGGHICLHFCHDSSHIEMRPKNCAIAEKAYLRNFKGNLVGFMGICSCIGVVALPLISS